MSWAIWITGLPGSGKFVLVQTPWTAVEGVLVLARRLGRPDRRAETGADAEASRPCRL